MNRELKEGRFEIVKLEERIAPSCEGNLGQGNSGVVYTFDSTGDHVLVTPGTTADVPLAADTGLCTAVLGPA